MTRKYFGLYKKDKKCPSCKGPFYNPRNQSTSICETCESKACSVCGKISVLGAKASNDGFPFCPKHWSSFVRFKSEGSSLNLNWASDREFKIWVENRGKHLSERMGLALGLDANLEADLSSRATTRDHTSDEATIARESAIDKISDMITRGMILPGTDSDE